MGFFNYIISSISHFITSFFIVLYTFLGGYSEPVSITLPSSPTQVVTTTVATTTSAATTTKAVTAKKVNKKVATLPTSIPIAPAKAPPAPPVVTPTKTAEEVNAEVRRAVVNILCTSLSDGVLSSVSASGVFIDTRGVILTNAHIGQYFLLRDYPTPGTVTCTIRTGSPATAAYTAQLLYLPPLWVDANASKITAERPTGTGEHDYAFLLVTGATPFSTMPASFPALSMNLDAPSSGEDILLAAYPASFLDATSIERDLYISSAITKIGQLYTFDTPLHIDAISVGNTVVSQNGSSGGAVARLSDSHFVGLISTASTGTSTSQRILNAITLAHIDRSLSLQGEGGISTLLKGDIVSEAATFNMYTAPSEAKKIEAALQTHN